MGGSCDVKIVEGIPPCVNDPEMTLLVHNAAVATVGEQNVDNGNVILTMGSDDMSVFLQAVPGCYFIVGTKNAEKEADYPHHHPRFNIDEEALPIAVEVLTRAALDFLS
jgi:amidohydrolase